MIHVENSITVEKPVGQVFGLLGDPTRDPEWHFDVVEAARAPRSNGDGAAKNGLSPNGASTEAHPVEAPLAAGDRFRWVFDYMGQGREEATAEVMAVEPNRSLKILAIAGGLVQTINYVLEPAGPSSVKVIRTLDLDHEDMPAAAEEQMAPRINGRSEQYLIHLKKLLEEGKATPDGQNGCMCCEG